MALETGTFINQLVPSNPNGADPKGQGDDHIRLIKQTLKNTFPNIDKQVYANADHLNRIADPSMFFVRGMVMTFYGNAAPAGWAICDGQNGTPDLRNRFVFGAGGSYGPAAVGGSFDHSHGAEVYGTVLTEAQMPSHAHSFSIPMDASGNQDLQSMVPSNNRDEGPVGGFATNPAGGNQPHAHGIGIGGANHMPPFVALYYIMRL